MKRVYLQKFGDQLFGDFVFTAYEGLLHRRGEPLEIKYYDDINEVPKSFDNMVIGCIEDTVSYLTRLGVTVPPAMNVPEALMPFTLSRKLRVMKIEEFFETPLAPVFVKPVQIKQCQSGLIKSDNMKRLVLSDAPAGIDVLVSEPLDIINEYRVFIHNKKIIGIRQYGMVEKESHLFAFLNIHFVYGCLNLMNEANNTPVSYTMDFAILRDGPTEVIECNDGWSVSPYGLDASLFIEFLISRWHELIK